MEEQSKGKKGFKFNIVDVVILIVILAAAGVFVWRYAIRPGSPADSSQKLSPFTMTLNTEELSNEHFENGKLAVGGTMIDKNTGANMGTVIAIDVKPARSYSVKADGTWSTESKPNHSHVTVTVEGKGFRPKDGGLMVNGLQIFQNKGFEVNVNDSAFWFRVVEFTLEAE